jgi:hypothetical protein
MSVERVSLNRGSPAFLLVLRFETKINVQISKHGAIGLLGQYQHHNKTFGGLNEKVSNISWSFIVISFKPRDGSIPNNIGHYGIGRRGCI